MPGPKAGNHAAYHQRFLSKISSTDPDKCWFWKGFVDRQGYSRFHSDFTHKVDKGHRWSYEHYKGPIPEGLVLDHLCRNRSCVNPNHLEAVTYSVNILRGDLGTTKLFNCLECGVPFTSKSTFTKWCSIKCRGRNERKRKNLKLAS